MNSLKDYIILNHVPVLTACDTIFKKFSVSPNTAEFPMLSSPSTLFQYFVFTCKALAEVAGMWHTGGGTSQPPIQDTGMIPSSIPYGQWAKTLIWSHSTALLLLVNCETIC